MNRATGSGSITLAGQPQAAAEMNILLAGFRSEINGLWRAETVRHTFGRAYMTTITLEATEEGREPP